MYFKIMKITHIEKVILVIDRINHQDMEGSGERSSPTTELVLKIISMKITETKATVIWSNLKLIMKTRWLEELELKCN